MKTLMLVSACAAAFTGAAAAQAPQAADASEDDDHVLGRIGRRRPMRPRT